MLCYLCPVVSLFWLGELVYNPASFARCVFSFVHRGIPRRGFVAFFVVKFPAPREFWKPCVVRAPAVLSGCVFC